MHQAKQVNQRPVKSDRTCENTFPISSPYFLVFELSCQPKSRKSSLVSWTCMKSEAMELAMQTNKVKFVGRFTFSEKQYYLNNLRAAIPQGSLWLRAGLLPYRLSPKIRNCCHMGKEFWAIRTRARLQHSDSIKSRTRIKVNTMEKQHSTS